MKSERSASFSIQALWSRTLRANGDIDKTAKYAIPVSPTQEPVTRGQVGNVTAFLCSPLASGITGEVVSVDNGYNIMGAPPDDLEETLKGSK